jgi:hypothetical protein
LGAVDARVNDWEALRPLLHPYLQCSDPGGATVRGRRNVMARLMGGAAIGPPGEYELR